MSYGVCGVEVVISFNPEFYPKWGINVKSPGILLPPYPDGSSGNF